MHSRGYAETSPGADMGNKNCFGCEGRRVEVRRSLHELLSSLAALSPLLAVWPWLSSQQDAPSLFSPPKVAATAQPQQTL